MFFFASLLITLYKYNSRLISYYYVRIYAVDSVNDQTTADYFAKIISTFSPDNVDYGKMPIPPVDIAGDIASKVADKVAETKAPS
jgi:hypothetical protein